MKVRPLRKRDIRKASVIVGEDWSKKYQRTSAVEMGAEFVNRVDPPKYVVAEEKGEVVGLGGYIQSWMDYHVYNIFWIAVKPKWQDKGIGTAIVGKIISDIKKREGENKAHMVLLTTNKPGFYAKKFGFKILTSFGDREHKLMGLKFSR